MQRVSRRHATNGAAADREALIVTDVQRDFCPGGALAVPRGDEIVAVVNRLARDLRMSS